MVCFNNDWDSLLVDEFNKSYYLKLREFLKAEYSAHKVYPNMNDIFNALKYCSYADTKVVILGQDPYHEEGQAHGLAFSVNKGITIPPSLRNIFKELKDDLGVTPPDNGYLKRWAEQGVLLLNTALTVRAGEANSHSGQGWETFTDNIMERLNQKTSPVVFILWGNNAKSKMKLLMNPQHVILLSVHPSPLSASRGFFGCKHFSKANDALVSAGHTPINWQL